MNEISRLFSAFCGSFSRRHLLPPSTLFCLCGKLISWSQVLQLSQLFQSSSLVTCILFTQNPQHFFSESSAVIWLWISVFIDLFLCTSWRGGAEIIELFTLSIALFFEFNSFSLLCFYSTLLTSSAIKRDFLFFVIVYFFGIFGTGLIIQNCGRNKFFRASVWRK
jgi:hypothetical protein